MEPRTGRADICPQAFREQCFAHKALRFWIWKILMGYPVRNSAPCSIILERSMKVICQNDMTTPIYQPALRPMNLLIRCKHLPRKQWMWTVNLSMSNLTAWMVPIQKILAENAFCSPSCRTVYDLSKFIRVVITMTTTGMLMETRSRTIPIMRVRPQINQLLACSRTPNSVVYLMKRLSFGAENLADSQPLNIEKGQVETITPTDLRCGWPVEESKGVLVLVRQMNWAVRQRDRPFSCQTPACYNTQSIGLGSKQPNLLPWRPR